LYSHVSKLDAVELAAPTAEFVDNCPCIMYDKICVFVVKFIL